MIASDQPNSTGNLPPGRAVQAEQQPREPAVEQRDVVELLRVDVGGHRCALPIDLVGGLHAAVQFMPLAGAPEHVLGLVNRHGHPLALMDLRRRLGLGAHPVTADDHMVVLRLQDHDVALVVDAAVEVINVPARAVDAAAAAAAPELAARGVAVVDGELIVILDADAFLSPADSAQLDEAMQRALTAATTPP